MAPSTPSRPPALPGTARLGIAAGAVGVVLFAVVLAFDLGPHQLRDAFPPAIYAVATAICLLRLRFPGADRSTLFLGAGIAAYGLGSLVYAAADDHYPIGVPWPALAGWGLFYLLAYAALIVSLRARLRALASSLALDGLVGGVTLTAILAAVLVPIVVGRHGITSADAAAGLAFPAADLLLIALLLCACAFSGWRGVHQWLALAAGAALLLVGDVVVDVQAATGTFDDHNPVWAVFPAGMVGMAAAVWIPARRPALVESDSFGLIAVPAMCFTAALGVQVAHLVGEVGDLAHALSLAAMALAAVRAATTHRELQRLREARRFERGFRDAEIGMVLIDMDGRWLRVNDAMCRVLGRRQDELVGITSDELVHPSDSGEGVEVRRRFHSDDPPRAATYELVVALPDGRPVELLVTTALVPGDAGQPWFFSQAQDMTERNRALRHSAALAELGRLAIETSDSQSLTDAALRIVVDALPCERCAVSSMRSAELEERSVPLRRRTGGLERLVVDLAPGGHGLDELDVRFLQAVADVLAGALDRAEAERETRRQALQDPLTGLANRAALERELDHALALSRDRGRTVALVLLDLDRFKVVNDTLGHGTGDALLGLVAQRLLRRTDAMDVVARLGGDEFVVVCPLVDGEADAVAAAERLLEAFELPFELAGRELFVSVSAGVALAQDEHATAESLVRDADVAMYHAKDAGGGQFAVFDAALRARIVRRLTLEHALRRATERDELLLHFQPIIELATGRLSGFEALVRWQHPEHGLVPPGDFIPVAEDTGLIGPIGAWVLEHACRQLAQFNADRAADDHLRMSVNLSPRQLTAGFPELVGLTLARTGVAAQDLVLEITESELVGQEQQLAVVVALRELGIAVALDDFGTGFSSLASVTAIALDRVKLDRTLIAGLGTSRSAGALVQAVVEMTRALGLEIVAEGIEEAHQFEAARDLGCAYGQGWFLARPMDAAAARELADGGFAPFRASAVAG